jgi:hypothetical protein
MLRNGYLTTTLKNNTTINLSSVLSAGQAIFAACRHLSGNLDIYTCIIFFRNNNGYIGAVNLGSNQFSIAANNSSGDITVVDLGSITILRIDYFYIYD